MNESNSNTWKNNPIVNQNVNRIAYLGYGYINSSTTDRCCSPQGAWHRQCQYVYEGSYCRDLCSRTLRVKDILEVWMINARLLLHPAVLSQVNWLQERLAYYISTELVDRKAPGKEATSKWDLEPNKFVKSFIKIKSQFDFSKFF